TANGGSGGTNGGGAAYILFYDHFWVSNSGTIQAVGGSGGAAGPGNGAGGPSFSILGDDIVINQAAVTISGGASANGVGGNGGAMFMTGQSATFSGSVTAAGA